MHETQVRTRTTAAQFVCIAALLLLSGQSALACSPEVKLDEATGAAQPQLDLEAALAEIEAQLTIADTGR